MNKNWQVDRILCLFLTWRKARRDVLEFSFRLSERKCKKSADVGQANNISSEMATDDGRSKKQGISFHSRILRLVGKYQWLADGESGIPCTNSQSHPFIYRVLSEFFFSLLSSINILTSTRRVVGNLTYVIFYFSLLFSVTSKHTHKKSCTRINIKRYIRLIVVKWVAKWKTINTWLFS